jgi:hypothetical protein
MAEITFPMPGDLVIATAYRNISGNSSVPLKEEVCTHIGTLDKLDDTTYALRDDQEEIVVQIDGVYSVEDDDFRYPKTFISGWLSPGVWGSWVVTN